MPTAAVYVRVSTDRQTVHNQLADLQRLVQARGYEPAIYEEVESAAKARPVLGRLLAMPAPARSRPWPCGRSTGSTGA